MKDFEVAICHNDLTGINIIRNEQSGRLNLIDFEYCTRNYVVFDVGNLFCEHVGYSKNKKQYPDDQEQETFIRAYLNARTNKDASDEAVQRFKEQVRLGAMVNICQRFADDGVQCVGTFMTQNGGWGGNGCCCHCLTVGH